MAFVKSKERAENYKSSAYSLILVGGLGMIFLILCCFSIIDLNLNKSSRILCFTVFLIMFLAFLYIGIRSLVYSKTLTELGNSEDELQDRIEDYFKTNFTCETIDEKAFADEDGYLTDEAKYFNREEVIKAILSEHFTELNGDFLDSETERMYNLIYGE